MEPMEERLRKIFADSFGLETLDDELGPGQVEEWDSLAHVGLMVALEQEFGVTISPAQAVELASVGRIKRFLAAEGVR
jgi:acyl carrier protein